MDKYETPMDKLNLITDMARVERARLAEEEGIGVDLAMNLFGWSGTRIAVAAQIQAPLRRSPQERFEAMAASAFALRRGFGVDAFTMMADGFVQEDEADVGDMKARFAAGDPTVRECVWVTHQERGDTRLLCACLPYHYILRSVEFDPTILEVIGAGGMLPRMLHQALEVEAPTRRNAAAMKHALQGLAEMGVEAHEF